MYHSQSDINFFPFPNTLAGDLAVTNFIQGVLNLLGPLLQIESDSRNGKHIPWRSFMNPPIGLVERISRLEGHPRRFWETFLQSEDILSSTPKRTAGEMARRLLRAILRGLFLSVFLFLITWSIAVAIACPIYCGRNISPLWMPQALKAIYGGVHVLVEIPLATFLILLGVDVRNHRAHSEDKNVLRGAQTPSPFPPSRADSDASREQSAVGRRLPSTDR